MRLLDQFQRLCDGLAKPNEPQAISLAEIAERLCCTERNARLLLRRMQDAHWLVWSAGRGRGNRSTLTLLSAPDALRMQRLHNLLAEGRLEAAFDGLPSQGRARLAQALPRFLGASQAGGLRIPFYRPLHALDPLNVTRRTEAHILAQVCCGLTEYSRERQGIIPALAHYWESSPDGRVWQFWLRPGLRFHDGRPVTARDAAMSIQRARDTAGAYQALFSQITHLDHDGQRLSLTLAAPDYLLLNRLAHHAASVVPAGDWLRGDFAHLPVGAGPFRLVRNNDYRASLVAFDAYFRERPLLDEIDIWVVPNGSVLPEVDIGHSHLHLPAAHWSSLQQLEQGCDFVLLNPANPAFARREHRLAIGQWLREAIEPVAHAAQRPMAAGYLPDWQHLPATQSTLPTLPSSLKLVTYQLPSHIELAECVAKRFASVGVATDLAVLPFPEFATLAWRSGPDGADIVIGGEVVHDDLVFGLYSGLAGGMLAEGWYDDDLRQQIRTAATRIAAEPDASQHLPQLEAAYAAIIQAGSLLPMRHTQQSMHFTPHLGGVQLAACGWMDFRYLWLRGR